VCGIIPPSLTAGKKFRKIFQVSLETKLLVITITAPRTENAESQGWTAAKQFLGSVDPIKVDLVNVEGAQAQ